jgi:hypothetical protein
LSLSVLRFFVAAVAILSSHAAWAARLKPPVETLLKAGTLVEAQWLAEQNDAASVRFKLLRCISACTPEVPTEFSVAMDANYRGLGQAGNAYIVHFNDTVKTFGGAPKRFNRDISSARLTSIEGAEPALFLANAEIRALFDTRRPAPTLPATLAQLKHADPQLADLYSAELAYRDSFRSQLSSADFDAIEAAINSPALWTVTRARLLAWLGTLAPERAIQRAIAIIQREPMTRGLNNPDAGLVLAAFAILPSNKPAPGLQVADLRRWLGAEQISVAENAAIAIRAIAPEQERLEVEKLLQRTLISANSRAFFTDHLRRLALMAQAASDAPSPRAN